MERRLGVVSLLIHDRSHIQRVNTLLSEYAPLILGRMGLPLREKGVHVIALIVEGTTDDLGALTGKLGRIPGLKVKSHLTDFRE
ncbi:TM1266 family iron-only hydrogenase system putative regulator [Spirochaeta thermophila]|uniref:Putative transcriptional regulator, CopG family n=1 Tax=Winmispira thermophila (strain ATCC 49972 / DSM 6192 / RI 19.B1) TaxID=665571 RepID=E0RPF4_WINT6|nr:TM1266 family iron-only hydrogenase system putative regulator [Spirochaeta thermophila]ADN02736.1 putative transcriptional regulator, CopG family [Spirochaeta thermophila DSM 6192]